MLITKLQKHKQLINFSAQKALKNYRESVTVNRDIYWLQACINILKEAQNEYIKLGDDIQF